jgi:CRISPR/Cas system-associated endonuclease Cas3-HD
MTLKELDFFKNWFSRYTGSVPCSDEGERKNISLKITHTYNVCKNILQIAQGQLSSEHALRVAETVALFHDIGRFAQYAQYKTFKDSISENHGKLGAKVLKHEGILSNLPENEQDLIIHAVKFHNAYLIPRVEDLDRTLYLKLVRDADKLDIWRVFVDYYNTSEKERTSAVGQELPDMPGYSEEVLSCIFQNKMASLRMLTTLNDFKITQLSWIYDLNFDISFRMLLERDYINEIASKLPQTEDIQRASTLLHEYVHSKIKVR